MALSQRLDLKQAQSLVMTPQLQQAIKLLQLSNLELASYVEQELEQNPLLKRDEGEDGAAEGREREEDDEGPRPVNGEAAALDTLNLAAGDGIARSGEAPLDTDYDNLWSGASEGEGADAQPYLGAWGRGAPREGDGGNALEQTVA